jgi:hypothetical protein
MVAATAQPGPASPLAQALGNQPALSLAVPLPGFLKPAGASTVATPLTGSLAITNFTLDNDKLGQLNPDIPLPQALPVSSAAPAVLGGPQSAPSPNVVQVVVPPCQFEWLGLRIESSLVLVTVTVEDLGAALLARIEEILASLARTLVEVLSLVAEKLIAAADRVVSFLPPVVIEALDLLAPPVPVTVLLAQYRFGPVTVGYQQQSLSASQVTIKVFAETGPDKPLGNLLVELDENQGNPSAVKTLSNSLMSSTGRAKPMDTESSSDSSSSSDNNNTPSPVLPTAGESGEAPTLIVPTPGGGYAFSLPPTLPTKQPARNQEEDDADSKDAILDDDDPLPPVLPEVALREESVPPGPQPVIVTTARRRESGPLGELSCQVVRLVVCVPRPPEALPLELVVQAKGDLASPPSSRAPLTVAYVRVPAQQGASSGYEDLVEQCREIRSSAESRELCADLVTASAGEVHDGLRWQSVAGLLSSPLFAVIISPPSRFSSRRRSDRLVLVLSFSRL